MKLERAQFDQGDERLTLHAGEQDPPLPDDNEGWVFDELVGKGCESVHIERMHDDCVWMALDEYRLTFTAEQGVLGVRISREG